MELFEVIEAVVFVIFDTMECLEPDDASEATEPLLILLKGGCSSSGLISVRDKVCEGDMAGSGSKAWKKLITYCNYVQCELFIPV